MSVLFVIRKENNILVLRKCPPKYSGVKGRGVCTSAGCRPWISGPR